MTFDPRTISKPVYEALKDLKGKTGDTPALKEQKNQALELYTYLSTWGMLRLKAEEKALNQVGKRVVVGKFFDCLAELSGASVAEDQGLETLKNLGTEEYLGLSGLGLAVAQEFSFWAAAVYHDVKEVD